MSSCILYQNEDKTALLLDIPRSIELAQGTPEEPCLKRLISCKPLEKPFPSLEPKSAKAKAKFGETPLKDLLLARHIQFSLREVNNEYTGPWCFSRIISRGDEESSSKKRKTGSTKALPDVTVKGLNTSLLAVHSSNNSGGIPIWSISEIPEFYQNSSLTTTKLTHTNVQAPEIYIPPNSTFVNRFITDASCFLLPTDNTYPNKSFNLILLDPPWPNKSVRRKANYSISSSTFTIQYLLSSIPISSLLASEGIVTLWITNKPAFHNLILEPGGIFEQWGVELIEEWVWVKITKDGEPMCEINGSWRKPYEILFVGRRIPDRINKGGDETEEKRAGIKRRVIFAVPDIHSRKPNLKELFEKSGLLRNSAEYEALEIFARNMTAGWWSWGNEVVEFQKEGYWVSSDPAKLSTYVEIEN